MKFACLEKVWQQRYHHMQRANGNLKILGDVTLAGQSLEGQGTAIHKQLAERKGQASPSTRHNPSLSFFPFVASAYGDKC